MSPVLDLESALPDRPIRVRPPTTIGPGSVAGLFVLLFGLLAAAVYWLGPDIATDWRLGRDLTLARDAKIEEANCRSRLFVFTVCDIGHREEAPGSPRHTFWYFFIDTAGREPINLLRAKSGAEALTTNLGLEKLYHRIFALLLMVALLVVCIAITVQVVRQGMVTRRALLALDGQRLKPIVVPVEGKVYIAHKRRRWTYLYDAGGRQERAFVELPTNNDPLFVTPDGKSALALAGPSGGVPLLLDMNLSALDLTDAEKVAFFSACRVALGVDPPPEAPR